MKYQSTSTNTKATNPKLPPRPRRARTYASPLRAEQAAQTRSRIVVAYGELVLNGDDAAITVQKVAARAGVPVPTFYRNFTSLEEVGDAFWATIEPRLGSVENIHTADDLPGYTQRLFEHLEREPVLQVMLWTRTGRRLRDRTVPRRNEAFARVLAPLTKRMAEREARAVAAMCKVISSGHVWTLMQSDWGLTGAEAGQAAAWALRVLIESLRRNPNPFGHTTQQKG